MRRVRVRGGLVAAALVGGIVQAAPVAAAENELRISATKSSSAKIEIADQTTFDPGAITISGGSERLIVSIRSLKPGRGSVDWFTIVRLIDVRSDRQLGGSFQLPAGPYEVAVVTERPVRVTLPTYEPHGTREVRPSRPLVVKSTSTEKPLAAGRSAMSTAMPAVVPAGRYALVAYKLTGQRAEQTYGCATTINACPEGPLLTPPNPLPAVEPGIHPVSADDKGVIRMYAPVGERRDALFGVQGVRTQNGTLKALVITFG